MQVVVLFLILLMSKKRARRKTPYEILLAADHLQFLKRFCLGHAARGSCICILEQRDLERKEMHNIKF